MTLGIFCGVALAVCVGYVMGELILMWIFNEGPHDDSADDWERWDD